MKHLWLYTQLTTSLDCLVSFLLDRMPHKLSNAFWYCINDKDAYLNWNPEGQDA